MRSERNPNGSCHSSSCTGPGMLPTMPGMMPTVSRVPSHIQRPQPWPVMLGHWRKHQQTPHVCMAMAWDTLIVRGLWVPQDAEREMSLPG